MRLRPDVARAVVANIVWNATGDAELAEAAAAIVSRVEASPVQVTDSLADALADRLVARHATVALTTPEDREPVQSKRQQVTDAAILDDVVLVERVARRLRRFVQGIVSRTIEVKPALEAAPPIDEVTRAKAQRALARSGFLRVSP